MRALSTPWLVAACLHVLASAAFCSTPAGPVSSWGTYFGTGRSAVPNGEYLAVSTGGYHNLAIKADGSLAAWGDCLRGQCNVPPGRNFAAIATGLYHNLALRANGSLAVWGDNSRGQCRILADGKYLAIAAGHWHSLAVRSDGSLAAWGWDDHGQCQVPSGNDYVSVSGGYYHSLALKADGTIVAWGGNGDGQCDVPTGDFICIAAGAMHSVALRSNGTIAAWGRNSEGQCRAPTGNDFVAIAAGSLHNLALRRNGRIVAWGPNSYAECDVPQQEPFAAVAAGGFHSLAIRGAHIGIMPPHQIKTIEADRREALVTPSLRTDTTTPRVEPVQTSRPQAAPVRQTAIPAATELNGVKDAPASGGEKDKAVAPVQPVESQAEPDIPVDFAGLFHESVVAGDYVGADANAAPVYHFISLADKKHFCTISDKERYDLIDRHADTWKYQGIAFFAYPAGRQPPHARPVYRFRSDSRSQYFYTMEERVKETLLSRHAHVWTFEGIAWYTPPAPSADKE